MLPYVNIHPPPDGVGNRTPHGGVHPWDADMQLVATLGEQLSDAQAVGETDATSTQDVHARPVSARGGRTDFVRGADCAPGRSCGWPASGLPVVLHCVRAFEPLMRELAASEPRAVIFHGFIGSPEQARQALAKGYCLSFGERTFASPKTLAALRETPLSQLFLETDDSPVPIGNLRPGGGGEKGCRRRSCNGNF